MLNLSLSRFTERSNGFTHSTSNSWGEPYLRGVQVRSFTTFRFFFVFFCVLQDLLCVYIYICKKCVQFFCLFRVYFRPEEETFCRPPPSSHFVNVCIPTSVFFFFGVGCGYVSCVHACIMYHVCIFAFLKLVKRLYKCTFDWQTVFLF